MMTSKKSRPKKSHPKILVNDFLAEYRNRSGQYRTSIERVLKSGWYILGREVASFEKNFAAFLGAKYCIGVANGLEALQISLLASGIRPGDEVITTPISAVATTLAILAVGAVPVFSDIDQNGLLNPKLLKNKITPKTKAILPVHLYGASVDLSEILKICREHKLILIEDACQAHGAAFGQKSLGTFGLTGAFSFYPTKNLGAFGDGGAIVTNSSTIDHLCRQLRDYGQSQKYLHSKIGLNSRLDEIQAAILSVKLKYLKTDNQKRRQLANRYYDLLKTNKNIPIVNSNQLTNSAFHIFAIRTSQRDELKKYLFQKGIATLIHYPLTIPDQPMFKGKYRHLPIPEARRFVREILTLPCHPWLKMDDVDYICQKINEFSQD